MDSIRFPMRDYFPISEIQTTNKTSFSGHEEKEVVVAIPNGKKSYLWFCTNQQGEDTCYLVPRNFKTQPEWTEVSLLGLALSLSESPKPFFGTLISGTLVYLNHPTKNTANNTEYFVADDMFYFQGISLSKSMFQERLQYLVSFFRQFVPTPPPLNNLKPEKKTGKKNITLVLANMRGMKESPQTPIYKIHHWQLRILSFVSPYYALSSLTSPTSVPPINPIAPFPPDRPRENVENNTNTNKLEWIFQYQNPAYKQKAIFKIVPEEQCDIYTLYARLSNLSKQSQTTAVEWVSCGYAGIFEYNTSKLLNFHCRKIVSDIDQMEESDDEEESPPNSSCVQFFFECSFSTKFRKWVPVSFLPHGSPENVIAMDSIASLKSKLPHKYQPHATTTRKYT